MRNIWISFIVFMMVSVPEISCPSDIDKVVELGRFSVDSINEFLAMEFKGKSQKIDKISALFKGVTYNDKTLIGDKDKREVFVINLKEVDCFTFIDYVEAFSRSGNFIEFEANLKMVRYRDAVVDFKNRRHFFTDWAYDKDAHARDMTMLLAGDNVITTKKMLNLKEKRRFYLNGLKVINRDVSYIPSRFVDDKVIAKLKTGDYIGIYSNERGLDVSHVGIFIRDERGKAYLRHASSLKGKVVDQAFLNYIKNKPGIVVLRTTK